MKKIAVSRFVKDVILALLAWGIVTGLFCGLGLETGMAIVGAMFFAGIPFGWRWASKIISAVSIQGILIKLVISLFLGWVAIFVVLIGDLIRCFTAPAEEAVG